MICEKQSEAPKNSNNFSGKALIIASVVLVFTTFILGITFSGVQCGEGCSVVYRVCPKYAGTRCDMLSSNDWRRLSSGLSRGPRFENIHDPSKVHQYPGWYMVETIYTRDYK